MGEVNLDKLMKGIYGNQRKYANDRRRLNRLLKKAGIEFEYHQHHLMQDGACRAAYQWTFPKYPDADIIIGPFSYGGPMGAFESMGMPWDNQGEGYTVSIVTAREIIDYMTKGK